MHGIQEAGLIQIQDTFSFEKGRHWSINEAIEDASISGRVDHKNVLARVRGEAFLPNGISDNNRMYLLELWERQLIRLRPELNAGGLFGAFGHDQPLGAIELGDGKASHLVTDIFIEDNIGKIEYIVLNTDTGRNLNTYLRAGKQMAVSSRGFGSVKEVTAAGVEIVDPKTFYLETFDVVKIPGVPNAYPLLVESNAKKIQIAVIKPEVNKMDEVSQKLMLSLNEEKTTANLQLGEALKDNKALTAANAESERLVESYKKAVGDPSEAQALNEGILKWLLFPQFKKFAKDFPMWGGNVFKPSKGMEMLSPMVEAYANLDLDPKEITEKLEQLKKYESLGKYESLKLINEAAEAYGKLGKLEVLTRMVESLKKVKTKIREGRRNRLIAEASTKLSESFPDVKKEFITLSLKSMKTQDAVQAIKSLSESKPAPTPAAVTDPEKLKLANIRKDQPNPNAAGTPAAAGSTLQSRMYENMGRQPRN